MQCTPPPHQPGLILPSSLNVRQKAAVSTLCTLWIKPISCYFFLFKCIKLIEIRVDRSTMKPNLANVHHLVNSFSESILNRKCANSQRKNFPIKKSYRSTDNRERSCRLRGNSSQKLQASLKISSMCERMRIVL